MLFDRPGWIAFAGAVLLALITLFSSYNHVFIPGFATSLPLPQQAGIPCIFIALAAAASELKLASNSRYESAELRARAKYKTAEERERAARRHQLQARSLRAGALFQLEPSPLHRRFLSLIAIELAAEQQQN
jgi:hypothetical protein